MAVLLRRDDADDWVYRGEGAANLVLSYTGTSPDFIGKVLRVQKALRKGSSLTTGSSVLTAHECLLWKDYKDIVSSDSCEIAAQLYVQHVMAPLLGAEHVDAGIRVLVSREFLESVEKNVLGQRPAWRVDATKINVLCDSTLLISDHSIFPHGINRDSSCISVEIKPKCGFLPVSSFIAEKNAVKKTVTRFRMHQFLKLQKQEISQISNYDPLDLFSGSKQRIYKSMEDLFITPQNNFRVFINGCLVFGGLGGGTESTNPSTAEALEDALQWFIQSKDGSSTKNFLRLVSDTIFESSVLDNLLEVQKLDRFDIEGAIHAYYNMICQPCIVCKDKGEEHIQDSLHQIPLEESLNIVRDYLIAATAKDCSLMISFRPKEDQNSSSPYGNVLLESTGQNFDYKAYFIDLDMKPLKKIQYYYDLDQKIVSCYNKMVKEKHNTNKITCVKA